MAIVRPAITGDIIQDSWADQVTRALNNATLSGDTGGIGGTGSGTGPAGIDGFSTATLYLFRRNTTETPPADITVETTYNYETGVLTDPEGKTGDPDIEGDDIDGWYRVIPATTTGEFVYTIVINIADQGDTETIAPESWSTVTLLSRPGDASSTMLIQAMADDPDSSQVPVWVQPFMGITQVSPNFKNDTAMIIGLVPRIFEGGGEITVDQYNDAATTYLWSKNGETDFDLNAPQETGTGKTSRVLLINEMDIREGNINEVFNCIANY